MDRTVSTIPTCSKHGTPLTAYHHIGGGVYWVCHQCASEEAKRNATCPHGRHFGGHYCEECH